MQNLKEPVLQLKQLIIWSNNLFEHPANIDWSWVSSTFDDKPNDGAEKSNEEKLSNQNVFGIEEKSPSAVKTYR